MSFKGCDVIKILFITSDYRADIYRDLTSALKKNGHDIKVVLAEEKKKISKTVIKKEENIPILKVRIGNLYEVGLIEKALTILTISKLLKKGINKFWGKEKFDLILFESPPLTLFKVVKWAMKKYQAPSYLMMKDIFPQNGVDIGLYKKNSLIYKYFRQKEKKLYKTASKIGCMSKGNIDYLIKHNNYINKDKFELFPNTINFDNIKQLSIQEKYNIRNKYKIKDDEIVAVFGGNFGRPQGLDFLIEIIKSYQFNEKVKFLLVGRGTEKERIFKEIKANNFKRVLMYDFLPREDYERLLKACDIGLIFLDKRFTIPNYPSKTLTYFVGALPIMAAIDKNTDYKELLENENCGFWVENGDLDNYCSYFNRLISDKDLRIKMGQNGLKYLKENCNVKDSVKKIERFVGDKK